MKKKIVTLTKTTRLIKVADVLGDILSGVPDEELLLKYSLNWKQLNKVYSKLYYGGYVSEEEMALRIEMRSNGDVSHIPAVNVEHSRGFYECKTCGFSSVFHFSECPNCKQINLRRLRVRNGRFPVTSIGNFAASF